MPKKKLTKTQVKNKLKVARNAMYDLVLDKMTYKGTSFNKLTNK